MKTRQVCTDESLLAEQEATGETAATSKAEVSRRGFLGGMGAMMVGAAFATAGHSPAYADEAENVEDAEDVESEEEATEDETEEESTVGKMTITLDELNEMRQANIDAAQGYTCEDGTIIPEVYVKLRACIEGYGLGIGSNLVDTSFDFFMNYWTEDEAQAYIEMPMGVGFTAAEYAQKSGRDEEECEELCYDFSERGLLMRWTRGGVHYYHQIAYAHGLWEYGLLAAESQDENIEDFKSLDTATEWAELYQTEELPNTLIRANLHSTVFSDDQALYTSETPFYYAVPVSEDVLVEGEEILPLDNWQKIIDRNSIIGVSTCQCRLRRVVQDDLQDGCDHPMETCMTFGEEAEYYIENGIARQIDQDEARSILQHSVDVGMVIQCAHTKQSEVICSCHGDCCDILSSYVALGADGCAAINSMPNVSHYNLVVDTSICIGCGACADQCPLYAITMTDGVPVVDAKCVRCGQCATVCPVEARKLTLNEDYVELPQDMLQDYNLKAAYRFTNGIIHS